MSPRTARPILVMLGLGLVGLFFWTSPFAAPGSHYYRDMYDGWRTPDGRVTTLAVRLQEEEARYAATVNARQGLIRKYGPTKEDVNSWVFFFSLFYFSLLQGGPRRLHLFRLKKKKGGGCTVYQTCSNICS